MEKTHSTVTKLLLFFLVCLFPLVSQSKSRIRSGQGIILYTPYISRSVTPGKDLSYHVEIINQTNNIQNITLSVLGVPHNWKPSLRSGVNVIQQIAVKPKTLGKSDSKNIDLDLDIPLKIRKGSYHFKLIAKSDNGLEYVLPLRVRVTEQGILKTELQVPQANREGYANSSFDYNLTLKNHTTEKQNYALNAETPPGWDLRFEIASNYVTSVTVASNKTKQIHVHIKPNPNVKKGTYHLVVRANSGNSSAQTKLEIVVKGKYKMDLTTPSSRLSTDVTAGGKKTIKLLVKNTGSVPLNDVKLSSSTPDDWNVKFDPKQVSMLQPGESSTVDATIEASSKAIAGDYVLRINATTPNVSSKATFRVTVNKSVVWGSVGIGFIVLVIAGIFYLVKKYGRR